MHFQTTVAEIWSALLILFDMLKNAVCIPCPINDNFESEACSSRPQQLFIDPLAIQWPPIDPVTIYRPLGQSNWLLGSISTTLRTTGLVYCVIWTNVVNGYNEFDLDQALVFCKNQTIGCR